MGWTISTPAFVFPAGDGLAEGAKPRPSKHPNWLYQLIDGAWQAWQAWDEAKRPGAEEREPKGDGWIGLVATLYLAPELGGRAQWELGTRPGFSGPCSLFPFTHPSRNISRLLPPPLLSPPLPSLASRGLINLYPPPFVHPQPSSSHTRRLRSLLPSFVIPERGRGQGYAIR